MTSTCARPHSIIFADDDPDQLDYLALLAGLEGWEVDIAHTAEELLAKVKERCDGPRARCYDIVVSDVNFFKGGQPSISGITAGKQLERAFPDLPILFLSGYGGLLTRENINSIATADFMEKPVDPRALIDRINHLIEFSKMYEGPERRGPSVNRSPNKRRSTDKNLGIPRVLKLVMDANI